MCSFRCLLTHYQQAPEIKEKIKSTYARLYRLGTEDGTFRDEDEFKRKLFLLEYVFSTRCERALTLMPS